MTSTSALRALKDNGPRPLFLSRAWRVRLVGPALPALLGSVACGEARDTPEPPDGCRDGIVEVVDFTPGTGAGHNADRPEVVFGGPDGDEEGKQGSLDVLSLGAGGSITVALGCPVIDDDGPDFVVYENSFAIAGGGVFGEAAAVSVSEDGETFFPYPCAPQAGATEDDGVDGCAGLGVVFANPDNGLTGVFPDGGGDAFDLATVGLAEARFVRLQDLSENGLAPTGGFDLDAIASVRR